MVSDDLFDLADSPAVRLGEPRGELLVHLGAPSLRQRPVRDVLDQDVAELERRVARPPLTLATEQLFAHQRPEAGTQAAPCGFDQESRHRGALENPPNDRPPLGDRSFRRRQPVDPRRHQRFDRWGDRKRRVACLDDDPGKPRYLHTVRGVGFRFSSPDEIE